MTKSKPSYRWTTDSKGICIDGQYYPFREAAKLAPVELDYHTLRKRCLNRRKDGSRMTAEEAMTRPRGPATSSTTSDQSGRKTAAEKHREALEANAVARLRW